MLPFVPVRPTTYIELIQIISEFERGHGVSFRPWIIVYFSVTCGFREAGPRDRNADTVVNTFVFILSLV